MNQTFEHLKRVYFVGIKGIAMAALAVWAKERGLQVTGSDVDETFPSDPVLKKAGIKVLVGFSPTHISDTFKPDLVIYTGAHGGRDNPEVRGTTIRHSGVASRKGSWDGHERETPDIHIRKSRKDDNYCHDRDCATPSGSSSFPCNWVRGNTRIGFTGSL